MAASATLPRALAHDVVSPELALVDPQLAESARSELPTFDYLSTLPAHAASEPNRSGRNRTLDSVTWRGSASSRADKKRRKSTALMVGAAAVLGAVLLLADVRVQVGRTPAAADTSIQTRPPAPSVDATRKSAVSSRARSRRSQPAATGVSKSPAQPPTTRQLAWAPQPGAAGYHVELFKGATLVFRGDTSEPQLRVPAAWHLDGRSHTLEPGEYRWYVWSVVAGKRVSRAVVQAKLVIPAR